MALDTQHAMRMRHIVMCPAALYSTLRVFSQTARFSGEKSYWTQNAFFLFSLQLLLETFLILRRNERDMTKKNMALFTQSTLYSCPSLIKLEFSRKIF